VHCSHSKHWSSHLSKNRSARFLSRSWNSIHILSIISTFHYPWGILMHMATLALRFSSPSNNRSLLHWHFYSINVSFHTHRPRNVCLHNRGYTFCRASKDKSETDSLITIPYFSPRIYLILDREGIAPTISVPMSLFCGLLRTSSTAHHLHYNLPTYFPRRIHNIVHNNSFFNIICKVGICCTGI